MTVTKEIYVTMSSVAKGYVAWQEEKMGYANHVNNKALILHKKRTKQTQVPFPM